MKSIPLLMTIFINFFIDFVQFPCAFEFNELFLITVVDHLYRYCPLQFGFCIHTHTHTHTHTYIYLYPGEGGGGGGLWVD